MELKKLPHELTVCKVASIADIDYDATFTTKALYRLGFRWPIIDATYLHQVFEALVDIGFFDVLAEGGQDSAMS